MTGFNLISNSIDDKTIKVQYQRTLWGKQMEQVDFLQVRSSGNLMITSNLYPQGLGMQQLVPVFQRINGSVKVLNMPMAEFCQRNPSTCFKAAINIEQQKHCTSMNIINNFPGNKKPFKTYDPVCKVWR